MDRTPVRSTNLRAVGYDPETHTLEVEFVSGDIWQYRSVPPALYARLMGATSKGSFFSQHIRDRFHAHQVR